MNNCKTTHCPCTEECPLQKALKCIDGKWKIPIICVLSLGQGIRYGELMKKVTG